LNLAAEDASVISQLLAALQQCYTGKMKFVHSMENSTLESINKEATNLAPKSFGFLTSYDVRNRLAMVKHNFGTEWALLVMHAALKMQSLPSVMGKMKAIDKVRIRTVKDNIILQSSFLHSFSFFRILTFRCVTPKEKPMRKPRKK
jgi:hypothetical protein